MLKRDQLYKSVRGIKITLSALLLLLSSCFGYDILYTTPCGVGVVSRPNDGHKEISLEWATKLEAAGIWFELYSCEDLESRSVIIKTRSEETWLNTALVRVAGETYCPNTMESNTVVVIGNSKDHPGCAGSLVHEFVHVVDCPYENYTHEGWNQKTVDGRPSINERITLANTSTLE